RRSRAMIEGDLETLKPLLAEDLTYTHSSGAADGKVSLLEHLASGRLKYSRMDRSDERVRLYGDTAVVTGRASVEAESPATGPIRLRILFLDVWARQPDGRWQMVAWQSTRLPEPSPATSASLAR